MEEMKFSNRFNEVGGSRAYLSDVVRARNESSKPNNAAIIAQSINSMTQSLTKIANTKSAIDASMAQQEAKELLLSEEYMNADAVNKLNMIEQFQSQAADNSIAYNKSALTILGGEYSKQHGAVQKEKEQGAYNNAYSLFKTAVDDEFDTRPSDVKLKEAIDNYTENTKKELGVNLDKGVLKNMYLNGRFEDIKEKIELGNIEEAKEDYVKFKKDFSSKVFLGTTAKTAQVAVQQKMRQIEGMFSTYEQARQKQNKELAAEQLAQYERQLESDDLSVPPPSEVEQAVDLYKGDELQATKYKISLRKKWEEQQERAQFISKYTTLDSHPDVPTSVSKRWQEQVTQDSVAYLVAGDSNSFTKVAINNPKFMKETGSTVYSTIMTLDKKEELDNIMEKIKYVNETPNGATALRQTFSDKQYTDIITLDFLARQRTNGDLVKARELINQAKKNTTKQLWDDSTFEDMQENSVKLGPLANQYKAIMENLNNIDPSLASEYAEPLYDTMSKQLEKVTTLTSNGQEVTIETSKGPDIAKLEAINPEVVNETLVINFKKDNYGDVPTTISYLPNGQAYMFNGITGSNKVVNVKQLINKQNAEIARDQIRKNKGDIPVGDIALSAFVNVAEGLYDTAGTLVERATSTMSSESSNTLRVLNDVIHGRGVTNQTTYDVVAQEYITKDPTEDVNNTSTLSATQKEEIKNVVELQNKNIKAKIETVDVDKMFDFVRKEENADLMDLPDDAVLKPYILEKTDENGNKVYEVDIGYGTMLGDNLSEKEAKELVNSGISMTHIEAKAAAKEHYLNNIKTIDKTFPDAPVHIKNILGTLSYQMGDAWTDKFTNSIPKIEKAIKEPTPENWKEAQLELLNSKWYKEDTGPRALRTVHLLYPENNIGEVIKEKEKK